jgi:glycosyltransferase involved in cell wall biosynthesis
MTRAPLVSIVIPTYNQKEPFLRECIESASSQTYKNIEIVISDNHSTNNAKSIILEYALKDNRIRIVSPTTFLNMSESLLYVFTQASGDYICYLSSDDLLISDCVEILINKMLENSQVVFAHGEAIYFDKNNSAEIQWKYFNEQEGIYDFNREIVERLLNFNYVCFAGCMIKKYTWNEISDKLKNENLVFSSYLDLLITSMLFNKGSLYFYNKPLAKVRLENENRNTIYSNLINDTALIWDYWENDHSISKKIKNYYPGYMILKKKIYLELWQHLFYEYLNNLISLESFKIAYKSLKKFKIKSTFKNTFSCFCIKIFPYISIKIYQAKRKFV